MNIWGYKKKIKQATEELKTGKRNLGEKRFKILEKRISCWRNCIGKLREQRIKKRKK